MTNKLTINLTLGKYKREGVRRELYIILFVIGAVFTMYNGYKYFTLAGDVDVLSGRVAVLNSQIDEEVVSLKINPKEIESLKDEINVFNSIIVKENFAWTTLLDRLERTVPSRVVVEKISPNFSNRRISIAGNATDFQKVISFVEKLGKSKYFSDAILLSHSEKKNIRITAEGKVDRSATKIQFTVTALYEGIG